MPDDVAPIDPTSTDLTGVDIRVVLWIGVIAMVAVFLWSGGALAYGRSTGSWPMPRWQTSIVFLSSGLLIPGLLYVQLGVL